MAVIQSDKKEWANVISTAIDLSSDFEKVEPLSFDEWNSKFPSGRQKQHLEAFNSLNECPLENKDTFRSSFVKRELTMKGGVYEDFDPRCIQGGSDRVNAALGPFMHKVSKQVAKYWDIKNEICYTSGMTAEEIGCWRADFGNEDVTIIEIDESRYDAHQGPECYKNQQIVYDMCGLQQYYQAASAYKSMEKIVGYSSKGIKYSVDYTMTSGSATTSVGNSINNGVKTSYILKQALNLPFKMLVHGDDNLTVIKGHLSQDQMRKLKQKIILWNHALGFKSKVKISTQWEQVEYCSSLFWPVEGGYVLGPKLGKRLPKIGFSLNPLDVGEVKGMLLGLQIEAGFVPVIRAYAKRNLKLLKTVAKKEHLDKRRIYKSLPTTKHNSNDDTKVFFLSRYGLTVEEAENAYLECCKTNSLTSCDNFPLMEIFTSVDL